MRLEKVHWLLPRLRCGGCGKVTCADPPDGRAGTVAYGPNVNAAAILLSTEGNVPGGADRDADGRAAGDAGLGRVRRPRPGAARRRLEAAGFDEAMKAALRAEEVLCADETPVNVIRNTGADGAVRCRAARTWSPSAPPMSG